MTTIMSRQHQPTDGSDSEVSELDNSPPENALTVGLCSLWEQQLLVDFTIRVESRNFPAHKVVLSAVSNYFRTMLTGSTCMSECQKGVAVIEGVSVEMMDILLRFIYTNRLDVTEDNVTEVLAGAVYLQMLPAIQICTDYIMKNLDVDNWYDALSLFRTYNLVDGIKQVKDYLSTDIREIVKTFNNGQLEYKDFCYFIENWQSSELDLFHFVNKWVSADLDKRKAYLDELRSQVRYCLMTPTELEGIKKMKDCSESPRLCQLVDAAIDYHQLPYHRRVLEASEQTKVRSSSSFTIFSGNPVTNEGYLLEPLKERRFIEHDDLKLPDDLAPCAQININNFLILFTGSYDLRHWYVFDPRTLIWTKLAGLPREFFRTVIVHTDSHVYALGGICFRDHSIYESIEKYDFYTDTWSDFVSVLPEVVFEFGACIVGNELYVSGGRPDAYNATYTVASMHCMDLSTQVWEEKAPLMFPRSGHTMHVMQILGEDVICMVHTDFILEYYSPANDQWSRCTFTFDAERPIKKSMNMLVRGNGCFLFNLDVHTSFRENKHVCVVLRYPEEGTEGTVEYLDGYEGPLGFSYAWTVLAVSPHTKKYLKTADS